MLGSIQMIALLVFASLSLCAGVLLYFALKPPEALEKRLGALSDTDGRRGPKRVGFTAKARYVSSSALDSLKGVVGGLAPTRGRKAEPRLKKLLTYAGYRRENALRIYHGAKIFVAMVLFAFSIPLGVWLGQSPGGILLIGLLAAIAGYLIPDYWLNYSARRRQKEIVRNLPDALDLMVVCVEAGLGLDASLARVANEMRAASPALSSELLLVTQETKAGKPRAEALRGLTARTGVEDLSSLVAMLVQTDKLGTSVAQALRVHSDSVRTRRRQRAEEAAAKTTVKLVFPLVLCIFPALLAVILGPAVVTIIRAIQQITGKG
ncbi:MAG: type II secretion system F family protein [Candidatus Eisenbacteria bacterium]|nr:type II secretion system F family protein [Candidatus Eisenbacteria bacterium]